MRTDGTSWQLWDPAQDREREREGLSGAPPPRTLVTHLQGGDRSARARLLCYRVGDGKETVLQLVGGDLLHRRLTAEPQNRAKATLIAIARGNASNVSDVRASRSSATELLRGRASIMLRLRPTWP